MIIKLTNSEAKKIIEEHFKDLLKARGQRVEDVSGSYSGFEISCTDEPEEIVGPPMPAPTPGDDQ